MRTFSEQGTREFLTRTVSIENFLLEYCCRLKHRAAIIIETSGTRFNGMSFFFTFFTCLESQARRWSGGCRKKANSDIHPQRCLHPIDQSTLRRNMQYKQNLNRQLDRALFNPTGRKWCVKKKQRETRIFTLQNRQTDSLPFGHLCLAWVENTIPQRATNAREVQLCRHILISLPGTLILLNYGLCFVSWYFIALFF